MKNIIILILAISVGACAGSPFKPSNKMLSYKKSMSKKQAIKIFQKAIWRSDKSYKACGGEIPFDNTARFKVLNNSIKFQAIKMDRSVFMFGGSVVMDTSMRNGYKNVNLKYDEFGTIRLFTKPATAYNYDNVCKNDNRKEKYTIISMRCGLNCTIRFWEKNKNLDRVMAALMVLMPEASLVEIKKIYL